MRYSLGVDIGGTKILGAVVDEEGAIVSKTRVPTDREEGVDALPEAVDLFLAEATRPIEAIGLAVAGFVEHPSGHIVFAPNLSFSNPDIGEDICREYGLPVVVDEPGSPDTALDAALRSPAVSLFVERAQRVRPGFVVDRSNAS